MSSNLVFRALALAVGGFFALIAFPVLAYAFGGGTPAPSPTVKKCQAGYYKSKKTGKCLRRQCRRGSVYSIRRKKCVKRRSDLITDDDLYYEAAWLAKSERRYSDALDLLYQIKNQDQPRVLNYIGYTHRKMGLFEKGIKYYLKALELDPNYTLAMEYLGEGYLQLGEVEKSERLLKKINRLCGNCQEYQELAKEIASFKARNKS